MENTVDNKNIDWKLFVLSADTLKELDQKIDCLINFLAKNQDVSLIDISFFLMSTQQDKKFRFFSISDSANNLVDTLKSKDRGRFCNIKEKSECHDEIIFMFPGQGSDYKFMGRQLYENYQFFKKYFDECNDIFKSLTRLDLVDTYFYSEININDLSWDKKVIVSLNAILAIEYSLAKLVIHFGVDPTAFIGYSMGEITAAILSEAISLDDGIRLITKVAIGSKYLNDGALIAVKITATEVKEFLTEDVQIASINYLDIIILGGTADAIKIISNNLLDKGFFVKKINSECAYHTSHSNIISNKIASFVNTMKLRENKIPVFSSIAGSLIEGSSFSTPGYWIKLFSSKMNLFNTFKDCLFRYSSGIFFEAGPSSSMSSIVKKMGEDNWMQSAVLIASAPENEIFNLLVFLGKAWLNGASLKLHAIYEIDTVFENYKLNSLFSDIEKFKASNHTVNYQAEKKLPRNESEKVVLDIFRKILVYDDVSVDTDFFSIGGDSLLAMQCVSMLNESGFNINLLSFLVDPTVCGVANNSRRNEINYDIDDSSGYIPLIPLQIRFFKKPKHWLEQKLLPAFFLTALDLDIPVLKAACAALVRHHDSLRLRYEFKYNSWFQTVTESEETSFTYYTILDSDSVSQEIEKIILKEQSEF